ncbi:MAG: hypothetical protein GY719_40775 [bacterium]|nr:hypothetical protein [bacterium]
MKNNLPIAFLVFLVTLPAYADFSVGAEYSQVTRKLDIGAFDIDSESSDGLGAFLGFSWKTSIFYFKHYSEETAFEGLSVPYEKDQTSFEWHWNKKGAKEGNFVNTSAGLFHTNYALGPGIDTDFVGYSVGGGLTRFLKGPVFVNGRAKLHLLGSLSDEDLFEVSGDSADETSFWGYEAQVALGFQFGRRTAWSLQVGYKYHDTAFKGRFVDDTNQQAFVVMRFFAASKD